MKYLKVTLAVLVLAIICNATGVFATSSPIMVSLKLSGNKNTESKKILQYKNMSIVGQQPM